MASFPTPSRIAKSDFTPTRAAGLQRLSLFLPNAGSHYARTRNTDLGPDDRSNVSALSPFVRHRLVLETEIIAHVLQRFSASTAEKFLQEVFWRTYFKGWLEQRPGVWGDYRQKTASLLAEVERGGSLARRYEAAVTGQTGIGCFDAWAQELVATGYLHNHTRMWFASIWIFTLQLPWQLGADFFIRHLMDGDPASNTLSWRWVGGLHTQGKTYLARPDNIEAYTEGRFSPYGDLATTAPALREEVLHARKPIREAAAAAPTEVPVGLLITEDDCSPETLAGLDPCNVSATVVASALAKRSSFAIGARARAFAEGALADAVARARQSFGCEPVLAANAEEWAAALIDTARRSGVRAFVTGYAPVGPVAEALAMARQACDAEDIRIIEVRRALDNLTWPHASRGFFQVKAQIPDILEALERTTRPRLFD